MISSGIKRGVATFAISALAVAGLPFLAGSAGAVTNASQYGTDEVQLLSQFSSAASTKNDGTNSTIRLEAGAGANVSAVQFQYNTGNPNTFVNIGSPVTRNDDGAFSLEWDAAGLGGATVTLRAQSVNGTTTDPDAFDERASIAITGQGLPPNSVNLTDGSAKGYWPAKYTGGPAETVTILAGTTSATSGTVDLFHFFDGVAPPAAGNGEPVAAGSATVEAASGATTGTFAGVANITGYDFTGSPDELSFGARRDTDDVEAYALYEQTINTVTASPTSANTPGTTPATITITVTDQNGAPIANAEVRRQDGSLVGYTNAKGQITTSQGSGTQYYYANQTDSDPFEPSVGDKKSADVTVTPFTPAATSLVGNSRDGAAFDFDENDTTVFSTGAGTDITVQVKDQNGGNFNTDTQTLSYYWVATPFTGAAATRYPTTGVATATETGTGTYNVAFPQGGPEGTYELFASLGERPVQGGGNIAESKVLTVKAGESQVAYDEGSPEIAPAGTTEAVTGKLVLDDGTGLGGRGLDFTYNTTGGNATIQENSGTANDTIVTTGADGTFSFNVVDPAVAAPATQPTERGTLTVDPVNATTDSDHVGTDIGPDTQEVVFASAGAPAGSSVVITADNDTQRPGETQDVTVTVDGPAAGADPVTNTIVTLKVDEGFFTNEAGTTNLGKEITVVTDNTGVATADIGIQRNAGFDDDGLVTSIVTATSGSASDTEDYQWSSASPASAAGNTVDLIFASNQTVGVLPKAPWETEVVNFDVQAYDRFGNPAAGVVVQITDNTNQASTSLTTVTTDVDTRGDFVASADSAVDQRITATWAGGTQTGNPATATDLTDSETVNWYDIEVASATLTASGTNPHPVGSTVTMTYTAVDQNGEPIFNYGVDFFRAGPDDTNVGEPQTFGLTTNQRGEAYYVFQGEVAGTAKVTTVLYDTFNNLVPEGQASAEVVFGGRTAIDAVLKGRNTGADVDKLKVVTTPRGVADGAVVNLYRFNKQGVRVLVESSTLNANGIKRFQVADLNGRKYTKYVARVKRTDDSKAVKRTNFKRVR